MRKDGIEQSGQTVQQEQEQQGTRSSSSNTHATMKDRALEGSDKTPGAQTTRRVPDLGALALRHLSNS